MIPLKTMKILHFSYGHRYNKSLRSLVTKLPRSVGKRFYESNVLLAIVQIGNKNELIAINIPYKLYTTHPNRFNYRNIYIDIIKNRISLVDDSIDNNYKFRLFVDEEMNLMRLFSSSVTSRTRNIPKTKAEFDKTQKEVYKYIREQVRKKNYDKF